MTMVSITEVEARTVRIALANPVAFSTRKVDARHYTLVRVTCSDGSTGIGFCHGGTRYGGLATAAVRHMLRPGLLGQDPHRTEGLWQELYQDSLLNGRAGAVMRALSAVDIALWDRNARAAGLPLWRYLGAVHRETVPCYVSGGYYRGGGPEEIAEEVAGYVAEGFSAVKIKIGGASPSVDAQRVAAARAAMGPDGMLLLDANNAWNDLPAALRALEPLMPYKPYLIEEPFGPDDVMNHARLAEYLKVPLATGEILGGRWAHRELMQSGAITLLQPDTAVCGGITEWRRIAATAASLGISVSPHSMHHLNVHMVAATPNAAFVEYFPGTALLVFSLIVDRQIVVRGGRLVLPEGPGLGFDFLDAEVERYAVEPWA